MQAVDAVLRQWQEGKAKSRVLTIAHSEAMKESCREVLGNAAHARPELNFRLAVVLTGAAEQERLLKQPELREYTHTHHVLRPLTCREYLSYVQAQCEEHDCEHSPLPPARVRKMHTLTKGNISKLNALAHLSMLAAWTERAAQVSPRHLRLAAGEILPAKNTVSAWQPWGCLRPCYLPPAAGILPRRSARACRSSCRCPSAGNSRRQNLRQP